MKPSKRNRVPPTLIVSSLLLIIGTVIVVSLSTSVIRADYQREYEERIGILASYIETRLEEYDRVNEKIYVVYGDMIFSLGEMILNADEPINDEMLIEYTEMFSITGALYTDADGELLYVSDEIYRESAWVMDASHPNFTFFHSEKTSHLERRESYFFYYDVLVGSFKTDQGNMLQLGVHLHDGIIIDESLSLQSVVRDIGIMDNVLYAQFVNPDKEIVAHDNPVYIGEVTDATHLVNAIESQSSFGGEVEDCFAHEPSYCIVEPIFSDGEFMGVLSVGYDALYMEPIYTRINTVIILFASVTFLLIWSAIIFASRTRKKMVETLRMDSLTGIEGRQSLEYTLESVRHKPKVKQLRLVLFNVDAFNTLMPLYGMKFIDYMMKTFAERLKSEVGQNGLYKLNEDEFMWLSTIKEIDALETKVKTILSVTNQPIEHQSVKANVSMTAAIYTNINPGDSMDQVISNLKATLINAKTHHQGSYDIYDEAIVKKLWRRENILNCIRTALEENNDNFFVYFQPLYTVQGNKEINSFEALGRLYVPYLGMIPPDEFIAIAEEEGLIFSLGKTVLKHSIAFYESMVATQKTPLPISINASSYELMDETFAPNLLSTLKTHNIPPQYIQIELTETVFAQRTEAVNHSLQILKAAGIQVLIDDFGTGYSSLSYLKNYSIDFIKLDKIFVDQLVESDKDKAIAQSIVFIARALKAKLVAEGVETKAQLDVIKTIGCDYAQGFYYQKPLSKTEALKIMK